jgi:hypothetical protein
VSLYPARTAALSPEPAWSHEYDEHNGVVIDIEIKADPDKRFSYWDALSEQ